MPDDARQPETCRERRRDGLNVDPDQSAMEMSELLQLRIRRRDHCAWNGKSQTLASAGLAQDERIQADELAVDIDQRAAAVARIDRRVRLNEHARAVGIDLSCRRAHHAHRHRIAQTFRAPEREHQLALTDLIVIRESERRQSCRVDFQERKVDVLCDADNRRRNRAPGTGCQRLKRARRGCGAVDTTSTCCAPATT